MKLIGTLKEKVEKTKTVEEAKKLISEAGFDLNDEEIENITGGIQAGDIFKKTRGEFEKKPESESKGDEKRQVRETYF